MPMHYCPPTGGKRKLEFWIRSTRGTDRSEFVSVPKDWSDEEIKSELEEWCSQFGCWHMSESMMRYGWNDKKDFGNRK
jgi:hypothetical protein